MKEYRDRVARARNILVVGGGAVGLEMAGEIAEAYPPASGKKITIIHNKAKVLNDVYNDKLRVPLQQQAEELGISFIFNDSLEGEHAFLENPQTLTTKNGKVLNDVDLVIVSTGGKVNTEPLAKLVPSLVNRNGVKVEPTFQIPGFKNIFAVGDVADLPEQKQAAKAPGHGALVAKNIIASIDGKALTVSQKISFTRSLAYLHLLTNNMPNFQNYKAPAEMIVVTLGSAKGAGQIVSCPFSILKVRARCRSVLADQGSTLNHYRPCPFLGHSIRVPGSQELSRARSYSSPRLVPHSAIDSSVPTRGNAISHDCKLISLKSIDYDIPHT